MHDPLSPAEDTPSSATLPLPVNHPMELADICRDNRLAPGYLAAVEYHAELSSTNDRALELATDPHYPRPSLIVAERQTAGRGRGSNRWWAGAGALTFSLLTVMDEGQLPPERQPLVSLAVGLALRQALLAAVPEVSVGLKWPNDVWVNGHKVAGILIEAQAGSPPALVIGVGLNVNNSFDRAPADFQAEATSLADATGRHFALGTLLKAIVDALQVELAALAEDRLELAARWSEACVLTGRSVRFSTGRSILQGTCQGIAATGALLVDDGKQVRHCVAGTVRIVP